MEGPLAGVLVLDLTRALAGPIAGRLLSDLGAEVIKVEPPDGDLTRGSVPRVDGMAVYFVQANVGKRCVSIDLTRDAGRDLFLRMVDKADIVLENYRPDVMERLGLSYDVLSAVNPRVIMGSVSGWGKGNSSSGQGAFAAAIHAETGLVDGVSRNRPGEPPRHDPASHADVYGGMHVLAGLLAALYQRERTGRGQAVEVSMAESTLVANDLTAVELSGLDWDEGFRPGTNFAPILELGNGRFVSVTCDPEGPGGFRIWIQALGRPDLAENPRFETQAARRENEADLRAILAEYVATFDSAPALEEAIGVSAVICSEVRTVPEVAASQWAAEREAFVAVDIGQGNEVEIPQSSFRFSGAESGARPLVGFRGQHNSEVLAELLDLSDAEIDALTADGVVSDRLPGWLRD
ncbi:MAG: CoA transferase [Actinomycetia bacterium]|nr:CoA transferase [Actinomycetes bacterium]